MSLWKFGDFEAEVDFTDADFLDVLDEAKAAMHEAEQNVPVVGKNSDIIRAQCACFYVFFDTLFGDGAGERILCGKNSIKLCNEAAESLFDFETAEAKALDSKYNKYMPNQNAMQQFPHPQPQPNGNRQQRRNYQKQYGKGKYSNTGR